MRILVATSPFATSGSKPRELLDASGHEIVYNPHGRRLKAGEVEHLLPEMDAVIAGTEPYPMEVVAKCPRLKVISRVGIGLDNVNVRACTERGVMVTYTPDAPSQAVAELTVAFMLNLARFVQQSDRSVREQAWNRIIGWLLEEMTVGIVGVGRIGGRVVRLLQPFGCRILCTDISPDESRIEGARVTWTDKDTLLRESDVVSLHIPMSHKNRHYLGREELKRMKRGAFLINTARGGIVDEQALSESLDWGHLTGAALDVFESEPYEGPLSNTDRTILTAHIGASAQKSRYLMELGATEDCLRVLSGEAPQNPAPPEEL
ncbi:MAG TPA: phosphoglycerate dehydrogenase [Candidatus Hydrogenedentes bacterium]|nr:phosphoglycerate dehydrogenase [Candidatus Hydrogenedentota bacterium]